METEKKKYKRIMLKLSGEALANDKGFGIDPEVVYRLAGEIKEPVIPELKSPLLLAAEISGEALKEVPAVWIGHLPITWACLPLSSTLWHSRMPSKNGRYHKSADGYRNAADCRTLYPPQSDPTPGKRKSRYFWRWYRESLFYY